MERNWEEIGIEWEESPVGRQHGANKSDWREIGTAQIMRVKDVTKAVAAGLATAIMAGINGTSWRVTSQDVSRTYIENVPKTDRKTEELRERIFARIKGQRAAGFTTKVFTAPLPDGTEWNGTEADEYEQKYSELLAAAGVPEGLAIGLAAKAALPVRAKLEAAATAV